MVGTELAQIADLRHPLQVLPQFLQGHHHPLQGLHHPLHDLYHLPEGHSIQGLCLHHPLQGLLHPLLGAHHLL